MKEIVLKYIGGKGGKMWELKQEIKHVLHDGDEILIPVGFKTDLSSVPKILWGVLPPFGPFLLAALVHDYLYISDQSRGRKFADKEMIIVSNKLHSNKIDNYLRYWGVRVFGWIYFKYLDL